MNFLRNKPIHGINDDTFTSLFVKVFSNFASDEKDSGITLLSFFLIILFKLVNFWEEDTFGQEP